MNSKPRIVVNKHNPQVVETFSTIGNVVPLATSEMTKDAVRSADILIVRSETRVDKNLLEGSSVRFVGTLTVGTDHVDKDYLASKGIAFASAPGSNSNSVAEYIAAALLVWSQRTGKSLEGTTLGIVGVGNVGSKVVRVTKAFGMNVLLNDPPLARTIGDPSYRSLDALMNADFISLHVPLTKTGEDATYHLFDEERIKKMKRGAVLINTSRGAVVDSRSLNSSLSSEHLSAALLDVWENEPNIGTSLLNQTMLGTPHIAGYSFDGKLNAVKMVYGDVCKFLGTSSQSSINNEADISPRRIHIPYELIKPIEVVAYAVRHAYDIEYDDKQLRQIQNVPSSEQGKYFSKFRAEYRTRREFFNWRVELSDVQQSAQKILEQLGFKTVVR